MTDCEKIIPLLSAYYDDELSADCRELVRGHLDTCQQCTALLHLFGDVTDTFGDIEPPPELLESVMESLPEIAAVPRRAENPLFYALKRAIPAAACFAVLLLGLSLLRNAGGPKSDSVMMFSAAINEGAGTENAPQAAPRDADTGEAYVFDEAVKGYNAEHEDAVLEDGETPPQTFDGAKNGQADAEEDVEASTAPSASAGQEITVETPPAQTATATEAPPQLATGNAAGDDTRLEDYSAYYAVIKLIGEVPPILDEYVRADTGEGYLRIIIPADVARALIDDGADSLLRFDYALHDENSAEAIVILVPEDG